MPQATPNVVQHFGLVLDHSGSMKKLREGAIADYNATINAIKSAAKSTGIPTFISEVTLGEFLIRGPQVRNSVSFRPVEELNEKAEWAANGLTPLYDGIASIVGVLAGAPTRADADEIYTVVITTDGEEEGSQAHTKTTVRATIKSLLATGKWKFVFRVPIGMRSAVEDLGVPAEDILEWGTTMEGIKASTQATTDAVAAHFTKTVKGVRKGGFYAKTADITEGDVTKLVDITDKVSLYQVPSAAEGGTGMELLKFVLTRRQRMLKGASFYQHTKTEPRISPETNIILCDRESGKMYSGPEARIMIGLPSHENARLHFTGDNPKWVVFIQSFSTNRKLEAETGVVYWKEVGVEFTEEEYNRYKPKPAGEPVAKLTPADLPIVSPTPRPVKAKAPSKKRVAAAALSVVDEAGPSPSMPFAAAYNKLLGTIEELAEKPAEVGVAPPKPVASVWKWPLPTTTWTLDVRGTGGGSTQGDSQRPRSGLAVDAVRPPATVGPVRVFYPTRKLARDSGKSFVDLGKDAPRGERFYSVV